MLDGLAARADDVRADELVAELARDAVRLGVAGDVAALRRPRRRGRRTRAPGRRRASPCRVPAPARIDRARSRCRLGASPRIARRGDLGSRSARRRGRRSVRGASCPATSRRGCSSVVGEERLLLQIVRPRDPERHLARIVDAGCGDVVAGVAARRRSRAAARGGAFARAAGSERAEASCRGRGWSTARKPSFAYSSRGQSSASASR